jgi:molybdopterin converting factor small subunit
MPPVKLPGALRDLARLQAFLKEKTPSPAEKLLQQLFKQYGSWNNLESDAVIVVAIRHQLEAGYRSDKG